jgi:hypothetical protein
MSVENIQFPGNEPGLKAYFNILNAFRPSSGRLANPQDIGS